MTDDRKYRTEVPNIIDDLGLNPYERALYVHYKRVCGANGGQCTEGVRGTAERTKMSFSKVSNTRQALIDRGLIQMQPFGEVGGVSVTIVEIWHINTVYYASKNRPGVDGWKVEQLEEWVKGCSHSEHPPEATPPQEPNLNGGCSHSEQGCSHSEHKKEPIKNQTPKGVSGNQPQNNPGKKIKEESDEPGPRKQLMNEFIALSGLKMPHRKTDEKFWWSSIGELYELFNRDVDIGKKMIRQAIDELRRDKMRVAGPESLIKTARDLSAQANHKPRISLK